MFETEYPTTNELLASRRRRSNFLMGLLAFTVLLIFGVIGTLLFYFPDLPGPIAWLVGVGIFIAMAIPVLIWNYPRYGVYIVFAGAILCLSAPNGQRASIPTTMLPFWWNSSTMGQVYGTNALKPLVFSPAELIMMLSAFTWIVRSVSLRRFKLEPGAFFYPIALYTGIVLIGFVHGKVNGGDTTKALYEIRAQMHFFMMYLLTVNLIRERRHALAFLWIIICCVGFMGLGAGITYFAESSTITDQGILGHDDSLSFNLLFFIAFIAIITRLDRKMAIWSLLMLPMAVVASLANQRRAGIASFIIAFIPLLPILWVSFEQQRKRVLTFAFVFLAIAAVYIPAAWNAQGPWALPARAIRSQSDPNERDASSDYYRLCENLDLKATRDSQPLFGIGYGIPFYQPCVLPEFVMKQTDLLSFMAHNSVLWVWMRLGHIGFFCFIMMLATILVKGGHIIKEVKDPFLRVVGILAMLDVLMIFTFGKYDLVLANSRQMSLAAILVGVLAILSKLDSPPANEKTPPGQKVNLPYLAGLPVSETDL